MAAAAARPSLAAGFSDGCQLAEGLGASTFSPRTRAPPLIGTFTYPSARGEGRWGSRGAPAVRIDRTASTFDHAPLLTREDVQVYESEKVAED